tara:strand:+ start:554 stop:775 length:222 start_codon:yes stop_codon:yes gene_type:complete
MLVNNKNEVSTMCDCELTTEDGYKFFRLDDGKWVDSINEDQRDMTYNSFDQVVTFVDLSHYHRCDSCTKGGMK